MLKTRIDWAYLVSKRSDGHLMKEGFTPDLGNEKDCGGSHRLVNYKKDVLETVQRQISISEDENLFLCSCKSGRNNGD